MSPSAEPSGSARQPVRIDSSRAIADLSARADRGREVADLAVIAPSHLVRGTEFRMGYWANPKVPGSRPGRPTKNLFCLV